MENLSHEIVLSSVTENSHVKRVEIGFLSPTRDKLEKIVSREKVSGEFLKEALAGVTFHFSLEHVSRLVHDMITVGRDSYSAQSWRYVKMHLTEGDLSRVHPSREFKKLGLVNEYTKLAKVSIDAYDRMREMEIPAEDARFAFLWSFDSNIVVTLQGPKIVDFAVQNLNSTYNDIRTVADEVLQNFAKEFPQTVVRLRMIARQQGLKMEERKLLRQVRGPLFIDPNEKMETYWMLTDPAKSAAIAAHSCYQEKTPSEFIDEFSIEKQERILTATLDNGHTSIAEHPHFLVKFAMSEAGMQQLRRHRIPVQRAIDMWLAAKGDYPIVIPPTIKANPEALALLENVRLSSVKFRKLALKKGASLPELDGSVIVGVKVPAFLVTNATDIIHIGSRRLCNLAQWEIRAWMFQLAGELVSSAPELFKRFGPGCFTDKCTEGKRSCGRPEDFQKWRQSVWTK